jgi:hypothetical protein
MRLRDIPGLGIDRVAGRRAPMTGWSGAIACRHIRFVFSNEPVERLARPGGRVRRALDERSTR